MDHTRNHQGIAECKLQRLKWADFDDNDGDGDYIKRDNLIDNENDDICYEN